MSQNPQITFTINRCFVSGSDGRTQQTLVSGDRTFNLPTLAINPLVKSTFHLPPILAFGPLPASTPLVQRDNRRANSQSLSTKSVVMLTIVGRVSQEPIQRQILRGQSQGLRKLWRIIAGASTDHRRDKQVAGGVANDRQLGPTTTPETFISYTLNIIRAGVSALQAGCVNGPFRALINQAALAGVAKNCLK